MKTVGVRALRENPGVLNKSAQAGEVVLLTNRSEPMSLSVPFDDALLQQGVHVDIAVKLFEDGVLTLAKAAKIAKMPMASFMEKLAALDVVVVDQTREELLEDLEGLGD
jgi:predicted HTH domain antitoxin